MAFDAKEYFSALEPPVYVDRAGVAHTGRVLSIFEMGRIEQYLQASEGESPEQWRERSGKVLREIFPGNVAVVEEILDLPSEAFAEAFADFFAHQRRRPSASASV